VKNSWGTGWPSPASKDPVDKVQAAFFALYHCLFKLCASDEVDRFTNHTCLFAARVEMSVCRFCTNQIRQIYIGPALPCPALPCPALHYVWADGFRP